MMKNVLSMILYYFMATVFGTLAAAFVYMTACDLTLCVAGESFRFFCTDFFIKGLLVSFPLMISIALGLLVFYGIRHKLNYFVKVVTYILLCAFSWLLLVPVSFTLSERYEEAFGKSYEVPFLSAGYFRQEAGGVFYFSRVNGNGTADGIFIDLTGITGEKGSVVKFNNSIIDSDFSGQFADTLIRDSIKLPFVIVAPLEMYSTLMEKASVAWHKNYVCWLVFATFALALFSVASLENVSSWKLLNGLAVLIAAGCVCFFNYAYYYGLIFANVGQAWTTYFLGQAEKHTGFLHNLYSSSDILLAVINVGCFLIFLVAGPVMYFVNRKNTIGA